MKATFVLLSGILMVVSGCAVSQNGEKLAYSAYSVGDRTSVQLDEIVVSIQLEGDQYQNLHVELAAIVNPRNVEYDYSYGDVERIVQRLQPRIAGRLVEVFASVSGHNIGNMKWFREKSCNETQAIVDSYLKQWKHGSEYQVEVIVVSIYWTDGSVGRTIQRNRMWWD
jgi:hypothetical protein